MPLAKKAAATKPLIAKQQAKADTLAALLGLEGDVLDVAAVKIAAKHADQRAKDFKAYIAIITPKRKAKKAKD